MKQPSAQDILQALQDACRDIMNPPAPQPVCECGSTWVIPGRKNGLYCSNEHYLPGQDMPA